MDRAESTPVSVNWHIWAWCNYKCAFCFATFADIRRSLDLATAHRILVMLANAGVGKITFAGGEPTLCPWLDRVIIGAKKLGMTTMIVTNGTGITREFLAATEGSLDWIAISIDSPDEETQARLGRGDGTHVAQACRAACLAREAGVRLKINTVVARLNLHDDMHQLIRELAPERWKVFQMLPIAGENDEHAAELLISGAEFAAYVARHADLHPVAEDNDAMTNSYVMLDPLGRFYQNANGSYKRSPSVLEVGVRQALAEVGWDARKFAARGGEYDW